MKLEEMSNQRIYSEIFCCGDARTLSTRFMYHDLCNELDHRFATLTAERDALLKAITWALGAGDDFPDRQKGEGAYWWRKKLRDMAGLEWNGSEYVKKEQRNANT